MKRIYMLSNQLLFSQGVADLLRGQPGLEIVGQEVDAARAIEQIRDLKPDVVFVDSKTPDSIPSTVVAQILRAAPCARVVALTLENDQIFVYSGEQRSAQGVDDLLQVIEEENAGPGPITSQEWATLAAGRAQVYGFLSAFFKHPVDGPALKNLGAGSLQVVSSLEQGEDLTGDLRQGVRALERFQRRLANQSLGALQVELAQEYARLFLGGEMGGSLVKARESSNTNGEDLPAAALNASLYQAYTAAGMSLPADRLAQPDFISAELDFMGHLCSAESAAWVKNDARQALRLQGLECKFLRDHLVRWAPRLCDVLLMHARLDFYRGIASLTKGFILNEAYRVAELMEWTSLNEDESVHP